MSEITRAKQAFIIIMLILTILIITACPMPTLLAEGGSLHINITSGESAGSRSLDTVNFIFSGTGPNGEAFSVESADQNIVIENLTSGEWTIRVEGYNSDGTLIVIGQSPMTIAVYGETEINISLQPVDGEGDISISASWDSAYTVNPTVIAVITAADDTEITESLSVSGGSAETLITNLSSGFYRVSIQLFDDGELTAGSVWTVMVLDSIVTSAEASFDNINKTGERIVITDTEFSIAWDTDSSDDEYYRIYARAHGDYDWGFVQEITAVASPEFNIDNTNLAFGTWEFAVSAVTAGQESELHTSMDDNAAPVCGWYVDWIEI